MRLGVIADSHVCVDERAQNPVAWHNPFRLVDAHQRLGAALEHPLLADVDAVAVLGDLVHYGDRASLDTVVQVMTACDRPVLLLGGNHDVMEKGVRVEDAVAPAGAAHVWAPRCGEPPREATAIFDRAGLGLRVIDVTEEWPTETQPFAVSGTELVPGDLGVTLTHFPLLGFQRRVEDAGFLYSGHLSQLAAPPEFDTSWRAEVVLSGHLHLRAIETRDSTVQVSFAALVEAPYEIAAVDVERRGDEVHVSVACASVRQVDEARVPVFDPGAVERVIRPAPAAGASR